VQWEKCNFTPTRTARLEEKLHKRRTYYARGNYLELKEGKDVEDKECEGDQMLGKRERAEKKRPLDKRDWKRQEGGRVRRLNRENGNDTKTLTRKGKMTTELKTRGKEKGGKNKKANEGIDGFLG